MNANVLLKWLVPAALLLVAVIISDKWMGRVPEPAATAALDQREALSAAEAQALGVAGDTPHDTLATLVGQVKAMRNELQTLERGNATLTEENRRLRARESGIDSRIQSALGGISESTHNERRLAEEARRKSEENSREARSLLHSLQDQLAALKSGTEDDLPIGLGLRPEDGLSFQTSAGNDLLWIEPLDTSLTQNTAAKAPATPALPGSFSMPANPIERGQRELRAVAKGERELHDASASTEPVYTLPENATLLGSVAMTALIGRVPVDGTVNDPFPFKVLVGADNLAANGIELPEVAGAVMSGTATGDWTLSCVRGQIESITFVFKDGTIRSVPPPQTVTSRNQSAATGNSQRLRGGLGYLSDPHGIPCIAGERRSNAQQYLGTQSLLTAAGAGVAALFDSEDHSSGLFSNANGTLGISSSAGNSAVNSILSGGVSDIRTWVNKLYGEAFAAVYVPPAAQVAVHLDREITIDYAPAGRRVRHAHSAIQTSDLD
jgi:integrating conjugative element protein (TIGR03752 family)